MFSLNRVVSIGGVILDYPLFISTNEVYNEHIGFEDMTPSGNLVQHIQPIGSLNKEVVLYSKGNAWLKFNTIKELYNLDFKSLHEVVFTDNSVSSYLFNNNKKNVIEAYATYNGSLWYNVIINLIRS